LTPHVELTELGFDDGEYYNLSNLSTTIFVLSTIRQALYQVRNQTLHRMHIIRNQGWYASCWSVVILEELSFEQLLWFTDKRFLAAC